MLALTSSKRIIRAAIYAAILSAIPIAAIAQDAEADDPPPEAGRISYVSGNVSIQPVTADEWGQAYPNLPLGPGDRIFTDSNGRTEIQIGQTYVRIGPNSDVTLVDDSQFNINFGVAQGSIRLHSFSLWPRQLVDISTPNGNAEFGNQGDIRVDVLPNDGATVFTNLGQFADVTAAGNFRQELNYGQSLELAGSNPVYPQWLQPAGPDDLDAWAQERDQRLAQVASFNYVSPDIPGAADLDSYGDWQPQTEYGAVWFPRNVPAGWQPYQYGHWINRDPWGWVWVEDEPWGYAPFHYGRWVVYRGRWGWIPGPVHVRPVWSPALVVFAGGSNLGGGLSVWFPLGPGEPYRPWYRCSPHYIDRVNITNIREAPRVRVERTYVNVVNVTNITYVNKTYVTAVRRDDFGSGRRAKDVAVRMDPREIQHIQPLPKPIVAAPTRPIISRPVAHPVPVSIRRPVLINQQGKQIEAKPGASPVAPPVRPEPPVKPLPGRTIVAAPAHPVPGHPGQFQNQTPAQAGNQQQKPGNAPNQFPAGIPRANPVTPVPGYQREVSPREGNQPANQPTVNPSDPHRQQPVNAPNQFPAGIPRANPVTPVPGYQREVSPREGNQPANQPTVNPSDPRRQQPVNAPNQFPAGVPRANPVTPVPGYQREVSPRDGNSPANQPTVNPSDPRRQQPVQPTGRPITPSEQPQQNRPNQPQAGQPPRIPNYQEQNRPSQPIQQQPSQPAYQPQRPPNYQEQNRPNQPQNQPPVQNRQDRHEDQAPPPSNRQMNQERPATPPQSRSMPPPQPNHVPEQQRYEPQQSKPHNEVQKPNNNNKDQKQNDKKDDKKHD